MRSISAVAATVLLVVGLAELVAGAAWRHRLVSAPTVGELLDALQIARDVHRVAVVVALIALVVALATLGRAPAWCWLAWAAFAVRVVVAYVTAPGPGGGAAFLSNGATPAPAGLRDDVLGWFDAIVPVAVDVLGAALLTLAVAAQLVVVLRRRGAGTAAPPA